MSFLTQDKELVFLKQNVYNMEIMMNLKQLKIWKIT